MVGYFGRIKRIDLCRGVTQLLFTCSRSTVETLEKGVKYVQN